MFRTLEGYLNTPYAQFQTNQTQLSTTPMIASTVIPPSDLNMVATGITSTENIDLYLPANEYASTLSELNIQNKACAVANIGDLIKLNQSGPTQCGWYYNKNAKTGAITQRGYLSTSKGPIQGLASPPPQQPYILYFGNNTSGFNPPGSTSLQAGQQIIDTDECNTCTTCGNCPKKGCGYCTTSLKYIPITASNQAKYPFSSTETCSSAKIVTNASQCPPRPPAPTFKPNVSSSGVPLGIVRTSTVQPGACLPEANGRLSGVCLQSALQTAGCNAQGSLSLALNGFSSTTNISSIATNNPNIAAYASANPSFNLNNFLSSPSITAAGTEAQKLALANQTAKSAAATNPTNQTKNNTLSVDLCTKRGYFLDNYNFCSELTPSTPIPTTGWDLGCLQQAFLEEGLSKNGTMYPKMKNDDASKFYNTLGKWSDVRNYMKKTFTEIYKGGTEGFQSGPYKSPPFMLEAYNFKKFYITFKGIDKQPAIQQGISTNTQFIWQSGVLPGTINIFPVANQGLAFTVKGNSVVIAPFNANDTAQQKNTAFIIREGNIGKSLISIESVARPGNFLRHADYVFWLSPRNPDDDILNQDSTFQAMDPNSNNYTSSFFQSPADINPNARIYPGQASAIERGFGVKVDPPKAPLTLPGLEYYSFTEVKNSIPYRNIFVITKYSVISALPVNLNNKTFQVYALSNYVSEKDQTVTPTISMGTWNQMAYSVNSYSTGWGWQWTRDPDPIDAPPNTFPPMKILSKYRTQTKNMRLLTSNSMEYKGQPFQLKASVPNIVRNNYYGGADVRRFNFKVDGTVTQMIVRDKSGPFMRFEPLNERFFGDSTIFTEMRAPEIANIIIDGPPIQFLERGKEVLTSPGVNGTAVFNGNQAKIVNVDFDTYNFATFVFSLTSIPSCSSTSPCNVLRIGNIGNGNPMYGFVCGVYGSTNNNIQIAVYTMSKGNTVLKISRGVKLQINTFYMLSISSSTVTVYAINTKTNIASVAGTIVLDSTIVIKPTNSEPNLGPLIQIGDLNTSLNLNVAWLHLFDTSIGSVDPMKELIGYGPRGYESGLF